MQRNKKTSSQETYRLNKYLALCNAAPSRRAADELISSKRISINGTVIQDFSFQVNPIKDKVLLDNKPVNLPDNNYYVLLNKPKDCITTRKDEKNRKTVFDIINYPFNSQLKPVGRLDRNTTGLLLLTNDGDFIQLLTHPSNDVVKIYQVTLDRTASLSDVEAFEKGIELEDGFFKPDEVSLLENKRQVGIQIHSGRNRIVRRYFEAFGFKVDYLDRVYFAGLTKYKLPRGQSRILTEKDLRYVLKSVKKKG